MSYRAATHGRDLGSNIVQGFDFEPTSQSNSDFFWGQTQPRANLTQDFLSSDPQAQKAQLLSLYTQLKGLKGACQSSVNAPSQAKSKLVRFKKKGFRSGLDAPSFRSSVVPGNGLGTFFPQDVSGNFGCSQPVALPPPWGPRIQPIQEQISPQKKSRRTRDPTFISPDATLVGEHEKTGSPKTPNAVSGRDQKTASLVNLLNVIERRVARSMERFGDANFLVQHSSSVSLRTRPHIKCHHRNGSGDVPSLEHIQYAVRYGRVSPKDRLRRRSSFSTEATTGISSPAKKRRHRTYNPRGRRKPRVLVRDRSTMTRSGTSIDKKQGNRGRVVTPTNYRWRHRDSSDDTSTRAHQPKSRRPATDSRSDDSRGVGFDAMEALLNLLLNAQMRSSMLSQAMPAGLESGQKPNLLQPLELSQPYLSHATPGVMPFPPLLPQQPSDAAKTNARERDAFPRSEDTEKPLQLPRYDVIVEKGQGITEALKHIPVNEVEQDDLIVHVLERPHRSRELPLGLIRRGTDKLKMDQLKKLKKKKPYKVLRNPIPIPTCPESSDERMCTGQDPAERLRNRLTTCGNLLKSMKEQNDSFPMPAQSTIVNSALSSENIARVQSNLCSLLDNVTILQEVLKLAQSSAEIQKVNAHRGGYGKRMSTGADSSAPQTSSAPKAHFDILNHSLTLLIHNINHAICFYYDLVGDWRPMSAVLRTIQTSDSVRRGPHKFSIKEENSGSAQDRCFICRRSETDIAPERGTAEKVNGRLCGGQSKHESATESRRSYDSQLLQSRSPQQNPVCKTNSDWQLYLRHRRRRERRMTEAKHLQMRCEEASKDQTPQRLSAGGMERVLWNSLMVRGISVDASRFPARFQPIKVIEYLGGSGQLSRRVTEAARRTSGKGVWYPPIQSGKRSPVAKGAALIELLDVNIIEGSPVKQNPTSEIGGSDGLSDNDDDDNDKGWVVEGPDGGRLTLPKSSILKWYCSKESETKKTTDEGQYQMVLTLPSGRNKSCQTSLEEKYKPALIKPPLIKPTLKEPFKPPLIKPTLREPFKPALEEPFKQKIEYALNLICKNSSSNADINCSPRQRHLATQCDRPSVTQCPRHSASYSTTHSRTPSFGAAPEPTSKLPEEIIKTLTTSRRFRETLCSILRNRRQPESPRILPSIIRRRERNTSKAYSVFTATDLPTPALSPVVNFNRLTPEDVDKQMHIEGLDVLGQNGQSQTVLAEAGGANFQKVPLLDATIERELELFKQTFPQRDKRTLKPPLCSTIQSYLTLLPSQCASDHPPSGDWNPVVRCRGGQSGSAFEQEEARNNSTFESKIQSATDAYVPSRRQSEAETATSFRTSRGLRVKRIRRFRSISSISNMQSSVVYKGLVCDQIGVVAVQGMSLNIPEVTNIEWCDPDQGNGNRKEKQNLSSKIQLQVKMKDSGEPNSVINFAGILPRRLYQRSGVIIGDSSSKRFQTVNDFPIFTMRRYSRSRDPRIRFRQPMKRFPTSHGMENIISYFESGRNIKKDKGRRRKHKNKNRSHMNRCHNSNTDPAAAITCHNSNTDPAAAITCHNSNTDPAAAITTQTGQTPWKYTTNKGYENLQDGGMIQRQYPNLQQPPTNVEFQAALQDLLVLWKRLISNDPNFPGHSNQPLPQFLSNSRGFAENVLNEHTHDFRAGEDRGMHRFAMPSYYFCHCTRMSLERLRGGSDMRRPSNLDIRPRKGSRRSKENRPPELIDYYDATQRLKLLLSSAVEEKRSSDLQTVRDRTFDSQKVGKDRKRSSFQKAEKTPEFKVRRLPSDYQLHRLRFRQQTSICYLAPCDYYTKLSSPHVSIPSLSSVNTVSSFPHDCFQLPSYKTYLKGYQSYIGSSFGELNGICESKLCRLQSGFDYVKDEKRCIGETTYTASANQEHENVQYEPLLGWISWNTERGTMPRESVILNTAVIVKGDSRQKQPSKKGKKKKKKKDKDQEVHINLSIDETVEEEDPIPLSPLGDGLLTDLDDKSQDQNLTDLNSTTVKSKVGSQISTNKFHLQPTRSLHGSASQPVAASKPPDNELRFKMTPKHSTESLPSSTVTGCWNSFTTSLRSRKMKRPKQPSVAQLRTFKKTVLKAAEVQFQHATLSMMPKAGCTPMPVVQAHVKSSNFIQFPPEVPKPLSKEKVASCSRMLLLGMGLPEFHAHAKRKQRQAVKDVDVCSETIILDLDDQAVSDGQKSKKGSRKARKSKNRSRKKGSSKSKTSSKHKSQSRGKIGKRGGSGSKVHKKGTDSRSRARKRASRSMANKRAPKSKKSGRSQSRRKRASTSQALRKPRGSSFTGRRRKLGKYRQKPWSSTGESPDLGSLSIKHVATTNLLMQPRINATNNPPRRGRSKKGRASRNRNRNTRSHWRANPLRDQDGGQPQHVLPLTGEARHASGKDCGGSGTSSGESIRRFSAKLDLRDGIVSLESVECSPTAECADAVGFQRLGDSESQRSVMVTFKENLYSIQGNLLTEIIEKSCKDEEQRFQEIENYLSYPEGSQRVLKGEYSPRCLAPAVSEQDNDRPTTRDTATRFAAGEKRESSTLCSLKQKPSGSLFQKFVPVKQDHVRRNLRTGHFKLNRKRASLPTPTVYRPDQAGTCQSSRALDILLRSRRKYLTDIVRGLRKCRRKSQKVEKFGKIVDFWSQLKPADETGRALRTRTTPRVF
ncbi:unnamed protein product [Cyprideis torosa]|uniref:Uncharacterized protein n=1 Tax=Cyprideis torosa TaxID=163714 RepID=A0A7R8WHV6_9CRUS|nr:unnamed protein product [Cyprideis torosa]CAG0899888.1 unnamed protein product [Cyprideis torosa]